MTKTHSERKKPGLNSNSRDPSFPPGFLIRWLSWGRAVLAAFFLVPFTALMSLLVLCAGLLKKNRLGTRLAAFWGQTVLFVFGVRACVQGAEYLPGTGGAVLVFNHQSHFDIPALMAAVPGELRFGAKIELFKIPLFGRAMRAIGTLPIARHNRSEVLRTYKEAESRFIGEGVIFALAPEGTRQNQPVIGSFKKGPFLFALSAQVPLVPVVIKGAYEVLPKKARLPNIGRLFRSIHVEFLPPLATVGLTPSHVGDLQNRIRLSMVDVFAQLPPKG